MQQALEMKALYYIDRISTNLADGPSRGRGTKEVLADWVKLATRFPEVLKGLGHFKIRGGLEPRIEYHPMFEGEGRTDTMGTTHPEFQ